MKFPHARVPLYINNFILLFFPPPITYSRLRRPIGALRRSIAKRPVILPAKLHHAAHATARHSSWHWVLLFDIGDHALGSEEHTRDASSIL